MDSDIRPHRRLRQPVPKPPAGGNLNNKDTGSAAEVFRTPEEVAAEQALSEASKATRDQAAGRRPRQTSKWRERLTLHWPPGKKEWLVAAAILLLASGSVTAWLLTRHHPAAPVATAKPTKPKPAQPTTVPSTLTGLPVDPSVNLRPVTGVMIENSTYARPQSGLGQAGVVFEAIAEGGITRFLALFQDTAPDNVGPIRSVRPYYEQWNLGFDAALAHVGGSPEALADIKNWNVRDLDQFANGGSYHRIASRAAPHNVYTSISSLNQLEAGKGIEHSNFSGFARKKETPSKQPAAKTINLALSGPVYNVHYDYLAATNSYNRSEGGAPHVDANTNTQISPKVVIALVMPYSLEADGYHSDYNTIGSGPVYVFEDGGITIGQWSKPTSSSQFTFTDSAGKAIKLNPGQTWLTAISDTGKISYSP